MDPTPQVVPSELHTKKFPAQRHFLAVFFLSFTWGAFGVDRMYLGKWGTGILKLVTIGGLGVWGIIDLVLIMSGSMRDKWNRPLLQYNEYKGFVNKTILIFALILGVVVLINGLIAIAVLSQLFEALQNGNMPAGLDFLNGLTAPGLTPEQMTELGL